ncbi:MAG: spore germination protein, partial [Bacillota bacterium]
MALNKPAPIPLVKELPMNLVNLKYILGKNSDVVYREVVFAGNKQAVVMYVDSMTNKDWVSEFIIKPLIQKGEKAAELNPLELSKQTLYIPDITEHQTCEAFLERLYSGDCGFLVDGYNTGITTDLKTFDRRGVSEPQTEVVVR